MRKVIELKEGFSFIFEEENKKINRPRLDLHHLSIASNWMEITDFVAILECALKNKLGTKKKYHIGEIIVYGKLKNEFLVCFAIENYDDDIIEFDIVQTQQIVSKLNKILHMVNKLDVAKTY